jgi:hypothetical protein
MLKIPPTSPRDILPAISLFLASGFTFPYDGKFNCPIFSSTVIRPSSPSINSSLLLSATSSGVMRCATASGTKTADNATTTAGITILLDIFINRTVFIQTIKFDTKQPNMANIFKPQNTPTLLYVIQHKTAATFPPRHTAGFL